MAFNCFIKVIALDYDNIFALNCVSVINATGLDIFPLNVTRSHKSDPNHDQRIPGTTREGGSRPALDMSITQMIQKVATMIETRIRTMNVLSLMWQRKGLTSEMN